MADVYPNLPGFRKNLLDGGLTITPERDERQIVLICGTAEDGPLDQPVSIDAPESAEKLYGNGTLIQGIYEAMYANNPAPQVLAMRVGEAKSAETIFAAKEELVQIVESDGLSTQFKLENFIGEFEDNKVYYYNSKADIINNNAAVGFVNVLSFKDDMVTLDRSCNAYNDSGTDKMCYKFVYKPMSIKLTASFPGSIYNSVTAEASNDISVHGGIPTFSIYNPKSGVYSDFSLDISEKGTGIQNIKDVDGLVAAINSDPNSIPVVFAQTQSIKAQDTFLAVSDYADVTKPASVYGLGLGNDTIQDGVENVSGRIAGANLTESLISVKTVRMQYSDAIPKGAEIHSNLKQIPLNGKLEFIERRVVEEQATHNGDGSIGQTVTITLNALPGGLTTRVITQVVNVTQNQSLAFIPELTGNTFTVTGKINATDKVRVVYKYVATSLFTQKNNALELSSETDYFVTGKTIKFGQPLSYPLEINYKYNKVYKINEEVILSSPTESKITFRTTDVPNPGDLITVDYKYKPELPGVDPAVERGFDYVQKQLKGGVDGIVLTPEEKYTSMERALERIENIDIDGIHFKGWYLDETRTAYNGVTGEPYEVNVGYHILLNNYLELQNSNNSEVNGYMDVLPATDATRLEVDAWENRLSIINPEHPEYAATVVAPLDSRYLNVVVGPPRVFRNRRLGTWISQPGAVYASLACSLPTASATTNKFLGGTVSSAYTLSNKQKNRLAGARYVVINEDGTVVSGTTMAYNLSLPNNYNQSDYVNLSTVRIVQAVFKRIRKVGKAFIGEANSEPNRNALETAIKAELNAMIPTAIQSYNMQIIVTQAMRVLGQAKIKLTLAPQLELKIIEVECGIQ